VSGPIGSDLQDGLVAAVGIGGQQTVLAHFRVIGANISDAMAVRRECNPGIEIPKYELRCASKYWSAIQIPLALRADAGFTEVNIVSRPARR